METQMLLRRLEDLAQLDTDAVQVYAEALEHVKDENVRKEFERFQGEHQYHASTLSDTIVRLGGTKPDLKVDLMGRVADWVTAFRSMIGTKGPLHAMRTAEHYHNRRYGEAIAWDVGDEEVATMLKRFDADEKRHLAFVEERLGDSAPAGGGAG